MKVFSFPERTCLPRLNCILSCLLFFGGIMVTGLLSAQNAPLQFSPIPYSDPDIISPGRGAEQWENGSESVNYPSADSNYAVLDVYCRFPWTRLEDSIAGKYNWTYFDNLVRDAIDHGQKLSFGIMPVYDGEGTVFYDSAKSAYPLYLHKAMQAGSINTRDWISHGVWIPNWNHSYYLTRLRALHVALNAYILKSSYKGVLYKNAIYCIDVRGYGNYGEWHNAGIVEHVDEYPPGRRATATTLKAIINHHTQVFTQWPLSLMIASFDAGQYDAIMTPAEVTYFALTTRNTWGPLGWRRDQWGATDPYLDKLLKNNDKSYGTSPAFKEWITKRYLSSPVTGEPPRYISPGGPCDYWDLERQLTDYGATSLGNGNWGKKLTACGQENARAAFKRAGYRIILKAGSISNTISAGKPFSVSLAWQNIGIAPTYENWDVYFELKNDSNQLVWSQKSLFKPRLFAPKGDSTTITDNFILPTGVSLGEYKLNLIIKDPTGYRSPLPLAIRGRNSDGSYTLKEIVVSPGTCVTPAAIIRGIPACNSQPASLVLESATGTAPYKLLINGAIYDNILPGQTITTVSPPVQKIWSANPTPGSYIDSPVELGLKFKTSVPGSINGIRFFSSNEPSGIYTGHLWTSSGKLLDSAVYTNVKAASWNEVYFSKPVPIHADSTYIVSYHTSAGHYASTPGGLINEIKQSSLIVTGGINNGGSGVYMYGASRSFPIHSYNAANYWADVIFTPVNHTYTLTSITDDNNCNSTGELQAVSVDFTNTCDSFPSDTVPPNRTLEVLLGHTSACNGGSFSLFLDSASGSEPFDLVINGTTYSNVLVGETITDIQSPMQKFWNEKPTTNSYIDSPVELGMKFKTSISGKITGIRFLSSKDVSGIYTGHLWTSSGRLLDSLVFQNVKPDSWQEALFSTPVQINSDSVYIVSYHTQGNYASTPGGLKNTITRGYLTIPGDSIARGNGLYMYGPPGSFPANTYNSANYWADVIFAPDTTFTYTFELTGITDNAGQSKNGSLQTLSVVSSNNCDSVPPEDSLSATLGYSTDCNTQSFDLVLNSANGAEPYDLVINGVTYYDVMLGETITTVTAPSRSIWNINPTVVSAEDQPVEVGVKFKSSVDGYIKGIRFFSPANPSGVYTGHLWTSAGTMLRSVAFNNVAANGWQEVLFANPVWIKADSIYVASYHTAGGRYSATTGGLKNSVSRGSLTALGDSIAKGNGLYKYGPPGSFPSMTYNAHNYWVDVVFSADTSYTYTFDLTNITDQSGQTKSGSLYSLNIATPECSEAQRGTENSVTSPNTIAVKAMARQDPALKMIYSLEQNYPNPFSHYTTIKYSIAKPGRVNLSIYDIHGRLVKVLINAWQEPGSYSTQLDKSLLHSGLYLYKMETINFSEVKKLVVQ